MTNNQLAYDFYLKGNDYWSRFNVPLAIDTYSKAIQEDIEKGMQLNPDLIEIKFVKAVSYYWLDREYDKSIKILEELKSEAPNMADLYAFTAYNLRRQGKREESISELKKGIQLDPFNANYISNLCGTYQDLHQYDNQIESARQGLILIPDYKGFNYYIFVGYLRKNGDVKTALKESGSKEEDFQYEVYCYTRQYDKLIEFIRKDTLGKCYAFSGNVKEAIACGKKAVDLKPIKLDAYQGVVKEQDLMEIYIFTGNYDLALDKIEYLLSVPSDLGKGDLMINPMYDDLRNLSRFQKIINSAKS